MPYYDPISDVTTQWTGGTDNPPSPPAYQQIDDAVRQPTDPGTSDYIRAEFTDGSPAAEELGLVVSSEKQITEITVWSNISNDGPGPSCDVALKIGASYTANQTHSGLSRQWASKTFNATSDPSLFPIAPGTAINLRYQATGAGPGTSNTVYAAYAEYTEAEGGGAETRHMVKLPAAELVKELAA